MIRSALRFAAGLAALGAMAAPAAVPPVADAAQAYVVGDSYTFDMQNATTYSAGRTLSQAFAARGWTSVISGRGGRGLGGSITPTGLQQATKDCAVIRASQAVVVELGTNVTMDGTYFPTRAATMLKVIRGCNASARILWVTPGNLVTSTSYQTQLRRNVNTIIGLAGVTPIRWDFAYYRGTPSYFSAVDGFKHPRVDGPDADRRADGYDVLKSMIVDAVTR